jgi:hypothetical protein
MSFPQCQTHDHMGGKEPTNLKNSSLLPEEGGGGDGIKQRLFLTHGTKVMPYFIQCFLWLLMNYL